jgi:hypothetical protein
MPPNPHPCLGRLCHLINPKTQKKIHGQIVDSQGDKLFFKPCSNDPAKWVTQKEVHPDWVDHIGRDIKKS